MNIDGTQNVEIRHVLEGPENRVKLARYKRKVIKEAEENLRIIAINAVSGKSGVC